MSGRSAADIRRQLSVEQNVIAQLLATGKKKEAMKKIVSASKKGMADMLDLPYQGKRVGDVDEYKEAKKLTDELFQKVWKVYWGGAPFPLQKLMGFGDEDYMITLYQGMDVAGVFNQSSAGMDDRLKAWFVLGFYAFTYELASRPLLSYTNVLTAKNTYTKAGVAVDLLKTKYKVTILKDYFEPFLRNSIDHSSYILTNMKAGTFDAWNTVKGKKTGKKEYDVASVFRMTVRSLFFIIAYYCSWYELVIELDRRGALH